MQPTNKHLNLARLLKCFMGQHSVQGIGYFGSEKAAGSIIVTVFQLVSVIFSVFSVFCCMSKHLHAKIELITKGYATDE